MPVKKTRLTPKVKKRALTSLAPRCMNEWTQRVTQLAGAVACQLQRLVRQRVDAKGANHLLG